MNPRAQKTPHALDAFASEEVGGEQPVDPFESFLAESGNAHADTRVLDVLPLEASGPPTKPVRPPIVASRARKSNLLPIIAGGIIGASVLALIVESGILTRAKSPTSSVRTTRGAVENQFLSKPSSAAISKQS